jgi:chemotaxis protein histidine kinase CheA
METGLDEFKTLFLEEAEQNLTLLRQSLTALDGQPAAPSAEIAQRAAHTIRGMSASMGYEGVRDVSKAVEALFISWKKAGKVPPAEALACAGEGATALEAMVAAIKAGGAEPALPSGLLERLAGMQLLPA